MNVYAKFIEFDKIKYRQNTILQFGDSWQLIGNIVLANPGSAKPLLNKIDDQVKNHITKFYHSNFNSRKLNLNSWYKFNEDATIKRIVKIFNGWYVNNEKTIELNGVIQLFNTFNVKNQNLIEAVDTLPEDSDQLFSIGIEQFFNDKPTYFGFSSKVLNHIRLRTIAENIFNNSTNEIKALYHHKFGDNKFYHPTFINRSYKKDFFNIYKNDLLVNIHKRIVESEY